MLLVVVDFRISPIFLCKREGESEAAKLLPDFAGGGGRFGGRRCCLSGFVSVEGADLDLEVRAVRGGVEERSFSFQKSNAF